MSKLITGQDHATPLAGKVALVSGANRGIGRAIALELARLGADLVLTARDAQRLESVAALVCEMGRKAVVVPGDLREETFPDVLVSRAITALGRLDIIVNNAGATKRGEFLKLTNADWIDGFALKFFGAAWLTRSAWPHLIKTSGSVVMMSGAGGRTPDVHFTIGGPVNAAMLSLTKALAEQGISDGVQVNCICPGIIRTDRLDHRIDVSAKSWGVSREAASQRIRDEARIARIGEPDDVAALVGFIVSPRGRLLHGALIDVDAGLTKSL